MSAGQVMQFPLRAGLNEGDDPVQVPAGTLLTAENVCWRKSGRLEKRYGTSALTKLVIGGSPLSSGKRLVTRGDELALIDDSYLYAYSAALGAWKRVDRVPELGVEVDTMLDTPYGVSVSDVAISSGGLLVTAWVTGDPTATGLGSGIGKPYVQIVEQATGKILLAPSQLTNQGCNGIRVLISGTNAFVLTRDVSSMLVWSLDLTTLTVNNSATLRNDAKTPTGWDACLIGSDIVLCYCNSSNALKLYAYSYSAPATYTQVATGSITGESGTTFPAISIDGASGEAVYVVYYVSSSTKTRFAAANPSTLAQTVAPVDLEAAASNAVACVRIDASTVLAAWSTNDTNGYRACSAKVSSSGTVDTNSLRGTYATQFVTRPFAFQGRFFAIVADKSLLVTQKLLTSTYLVEVDTSSKSPLGTYVPHRYVGTVDALIGGTPGYYYLGAAALVSSTQAVLATPYLVAETPVQDNVWQGLRLVTISAGASLPVDQWRPLTWGQETYLAGSVLTAYDGRITFDYGVARSAWIASAVASGGGHLAAGDYLYAAVNEFRSAAGVLHRSASFAYPVAVSAGANQKVTIKFATQAVQNKATLVNGALLSTGSVPVMHVLYRSTVGGSTYHRLTYEPGYTTCELDPMVGLDSVLDTAADSDITATAGTAVTLASRPVLYTTGGILDDDQPPALLTMALHKQRLWGVDATRRTIWFSKSFLDDTGTAPGFSSDFRIQVDQDITALASLDEKLVIFAADRLWYLLGDGPAPNGQQSDLQGPIVVQSDVGCTTARSVVAGPDGVFFLSTRGLYLLTRGLELVWVGRAIKDKLASYPNITSAVLVAERNEVRFTANDVNSTSGIVLVFNYVEKQWSTWTYPAVAQAIVDACLWNGTYTTLFADGTVYREDASTYLDAGSTWVPVTLETAWISATGPVGYQRMRRAFLLGQRFTDCDVTLSFGFDHRASYPQSYTWASDKLSQFGDGVNVGMRCGSANGANPRCRAFRLKFQDATPSGPGAVIGTGQGCNLSAVGLEIVPKPNLDRRSARART